MRLTLHSQLVTVTRHYIHFNFSVGRWSVLFNVRAFFIVSNICSPYVYRLGYECCDIDTLKFEIICSANSVENAIIMYRFCLQSVLTLFHTLSNTSTFHIIFRSATINRGIQPLPHATVHPHTHIHQLPRNCILHCHQILIGIQNLLYFLHTTFKMQKKYSEINRIHNDNNNTSNNCF